MYCQKVKKNIVLAENAVRQNQFHDPSTLLIFPHEASHCPVSKLQTSSERMGFLLKLLCRMSLFHFSCKKKQNHCYESVGFCLFLIKNLSDEAEPDLDEDVGGSQI